MTDRRRSVLPGFGLSLGVAVAYLSAMVLLPLAALFVKAAGLGLSGIVRTATEPRVFAALRLSFGTAFVAALANAAIGTLLAWVLVRYRFPGRRLVLSVRVGHVRLTRRSLYVATPISPH